MQHNYSKHSKLNKIFKLNKNKMKKRFLKSDLQFLVDFLNQIAIN